MNQEEERNVRLCRCRDAQNPLFLRAMDLYRQSFPEHEQRLWPDQLSAMEDEAYHALLARREGELAGLAFCWDFDAYLYVEHLCVAPRLRGQGIGQRILALLACAGKPVVLEIDPPEEEISIRRRHFYERCGYVANSFAHVHPPYRPVFTGHRLVVMSSPRVLSQEERERFARDLRLRVMRYASPPAAEKPESGLKKGC